MEIDAGDISSERACKEGHRIGKLVQFSNAAKPYVQQVFKSVELDFEPLNILPARLFYCHD